MIHSCRVIKPVRLRLDLFILTFPIAFVLLCHDSEAESKAVALEIRAIKALGMLEEESLKARDRIIVDTRLSDLDTEFHAFPFQMYQFLDQQDVRVSMRRKQEVHLVTGQLLKLRLLSAASNGILLWLRWQAKSGELLLDTRVHLDFGDNVIAGAESVNRTGLILAIRAASPGTAVETSADPSGPQ